MKLMLQELRTQKGLTQRQLAAQINVTQGSVNKWENGHCWPSIPVFCQLCEALECTPNDLLKTEGETS